MLGIGNKNNVYFSFYFLCFVLLSLSQPAVEQLTALIPNWGTHRVAGDSTNRWLDRGTAGGKKTILAQKLARAERGNRKKDDRTRTKIKNTGEKILVS